jgi:Entner-Doudoroff aldolase
VSASEIIQRIEHGRVIAILRGDFRENGLAIASALADAGVSAIEITMNSPGVLELIATLSAAVAERVAIGAGTVLKPDEVANVARAGAKFIVSPNCNPVVIAHTKRLGLVSIPGCFTPTEVIAALDAGADAIKLFPATNLGPAYIKALRGPLNDVRLVPTGGVTPELAKEYRVSGAWAIGVGSELTRGGSSQIRSRAAEFVQAMETSQ